MALLPRGSRREYSLLSIGFDLAASVGVGALLGWWIDSRFDSEPWGIIICSSIGIVGGLLNFVRAAQKASRDARPAGLASEEDE